MATIHDPKDYAPSPVLRNTTDYDQWYRTQVQEAIEDPSPSIPHFQVMAEIREMLAKKKAEQAGIRG